MLRRSNLESLRNLILQATLPGAKSSVVASAFLAKCASITAVDLIQAEEFRFLEVFLI